MLFSVAGSSLLIQGNPGWLAIAEAEAMGMVGGQWTLADIGAEYDDGVSRFIKTGLTPGQMQVVFGAVPADPGQAALWAAYAGLDDAAFRLEFPGGVEWRQFRALVIGMGEVLEEANSVIRLQAILQINSAIERN